MIEFSLSYLFKRKVARFQSLAQQACWFVSTASVEQIPVGIWTEFKQFVCDAHVFWRLQIVCPLALCFIRWPLQCFVCSAANPLTCSPGFGCNGTNTRTQTDRCDAQQFINIITRSLSDPLHFAFLKWERNMTGNSLPVCSDSWGVIHLSDCVF